MKYLLILLLLTGAAACNSEATIEENTDSAIHTDHVDTTAGSMVTDTIPSPETHADTSR